MAVEIVIVVILLILIVIGILIGTYIDEIRSFLNRTLCASRNGRRVNSNRIPRQHRLVVFDDIEDSIAERRNQYADRNLGNEDTTSSISFSGGALPFIIRNPFAKPKLYIQCGKFIENDYPLLSGSYILKVDATNDAILLDLKFEECDICPHVGSLRVTQGECSVLNLQGFYGCKTGKLALNFEYLERKYEIRGKISTKTEDQDSIKGISCCVNDGKRMKQDKFTLHRIGVGDDIAEGLTPGGIMADTTVPYQTCEELKQREIKKITIDKAFSIESHEVFNAISEDNDCQICFDHAIDCVLQPCGHLCLCSYCGERLTQDPKCPICRATIVHIMIPE